KEDALDREGRSQENANGEFRNNPQSDSAQAVSEETTAPLAEGEAVAVAPVEQQGNGSEATQAEPDHGPGMREASISLEASLPPTIYEQFVDAVARGEEARDEIPSHPDDIAGDEQPHATDLAAEAPELAADRAAEDQPREEKSRHEDSAGNWDAGSPSGEG